MATNIPSSANESPLIDITENNKQTMKIMQNYIYGEACNFLLLNDNSK